MIATAGDDGASMGDELEVFDRVGGISDGVQQFAGLAVPKANGAIVAAGNQYMTATRKADAIDGGSMADEEATLACGEIPDREAAIIVADRQELIIGAKAETTDARVWVMIG